MALHSENDDLLRALDMQFLQERHGKNQNDEVQAEISGHGPDEPLPVVNSTMRIFDALIPVGLHGNAVQGERNVLEEITQY